MVQVKARATINVLGENPVVHIFFVIHEGTCAAEGLWERKGVWPIFVKQYFVPVSQMEDG